MCARISKDRKLAEFNYAPDITHLNVLYIIAIWNFAAYCKSIITSEQLDSDSL